MIAKTSLLTVGDFLTKVGMEAELNRLLAEEWRIVGTTAAYIVLERMELTPEEAAAQAG